MNELEAAPAFPAALPPSLSDSAIIAEHDWRAFCEVDALANHWDRPGWTPSRHSYHWILTLGDQLALTELAERCQRAVAAFGLDLVAAESLHLTLCRVGFTDQVSESEAHSIAETARRHAADCGPLRLTIGPVTSSKGAVRFTVSPWAPLMELHDLLTEATVIVLGKQTTATNQFRPHVGIAYSNRTIPASLVREAIEPLRQLPAVDVSTDAAHLVILGREEGAYRWEKFKLLRLTGKGRGVGIPTAARLPSGALGLLPATTEEGPEGP